jgi:hypothetical protein
MRKASTARSSRLQSGAMQLGASLRGMVYGFALIVAAPLAWTGSKPAAALLIGTVALIGIGFEAVIHIRGDRDPRT